MNIIRPKIKGLLVFQPSLFSDDRGYFFESYRSELFRQEGLQDEFVQENESMSKKGVLRGMHFQKPPYAQGKLVRVVVGSALDVVVDIRKDSATYGQHFTIELSGKNKTSLWVPPGFAHGFLTLEDDTIFQYKCTAYYNKDSEDSIRWNDPDLNISWPIVSPVVSEKDELAPLFSMLKSEF